MNQVETMKESGPGKTATAGNMTDISIPATMQKPLHHSRRYFLSLYGREQLRRCVNGYRPCLMQLCALDGCSLVEAMGNLLVRPEMNEHAAMMLCVVVAEIADPCLGVDA